MFIFKKINISTVILKPLIDLLNHSITNKHLVHKLTKLSSNCLLKKFWQLYIIATRNYSQNVYLITLIRTCK